MAIHKINEFTVMSRVLNSWHLWKEKEIVLLSRQTRFIMFNEYEIDKIIHNFLCIQLVPLQASSQGLAL